MNLKNLLKNLLNNQLTNPPKWAGVVMLVLAIVGFGDAVFLTIEHFRGGIPPCGVYGCEEVLTSKYAVFFGIPVALFGAFYYASIAVLSLLFLDLKREVFLRIATYLTTLGLVASLWFVYLQAFVIKAYCLYCLLSALLSIVLFLVSLRVWFISKHFSHLPLIINIIK